MANKTLKIGIYTSEMIEGGQIIFYVKLKSTATSMYTFRGKDKRKKIKNKNFNHQGKYFLKIDIKFSFNSFKA